MSKLGNLRAKQRAKQFISEYLSQRPCVDCGESDTEVLTFDHVRGKKREDLAQELSDKYS